MVKPVVCKVLLTLQDKALASQKEARSALAKKIREEKAAVDAKARAAAAAEKKAAEAEKAAAVKAEVKEEGTDAVEVRCYINTLCFVVISRVLHLPVSTLRGS